MTDTAIKQNGGSDAVDTNGTNGNAAKGMFDIHSVLRIDKIPGNDGEFNKRAVSIVDLPAGALFSPIEEATNAEKPNYLTVQTGKDTHIWLNSDLHYINHSCRPKLEFDMSKFEIRVARDLEGGLKAGEDLSFFYPSTEWDMEQKFNCFCKETCCLKEIQGAKYLKKEDVARYWFNPHIEQLLKAGAEGKASEAKKGEAPGN